jgi:GTP-binding protein
MIPVIALVGRPNVGKSTLFNRLTKTRDALVADQPGLTRDRKYGSGRVGPCPYVLVDTGGISGMEEGIDEQMTHQSYLAMDEADIVLFLVDAKAGLTAADRMIAEHLRRTDKVVHLIVNKIDGHHMEVVTAEFHECALGEPLAIAAAHNRGVTTLMDWVLEPFVEPSEAASESLFEDDESFDAVSSTSSLEDSALVNPSLEASDSGSPHLETKGIKISIVGRPNVGKSTLVNRMLGEERVVVYDQAGTTRDSIYIPYEREGEVYTLIDTAGVRRRRSVSEVAEKFSVIKALQAIQDSHVCICVLDARVGLVEQDLTMLSFVLNSGRALVLAINKWDGMAVDEKEKVKADIQRRLEFINFADIHFISAKHGTNVGHLYSSVSDAYRSATTKFSTNQLTRILEDAVMDHQPPLVNSRRIKLRYAHQGGMNPPLIVVHGNQTDKLPEAYKRYLANTFRRVLSISGTPIRFEFKKGDNPYADKKSTGPRNQKVRDQLAKRRRIVETKEVKRKAKRQKKNRRLN